MLKPKPRRYRWYSARKEYNGALVGQCLGSDDEHVALRYHYIWPFRIPQQVKRDAILEEVNDPRYLVRIGKWFGKFFLNLDFFDV